MKDNKLRVAVYGTLRLNQGNYNYLLRDKSIHLGTEVLNGFGMVSLGGFPSVYSSEDPNSSIVVDVFEIDKNVFSRLDSLEGYPSFYDRKIVETSHGDAWMYVIEENTPERSSRGSLNAVDGGDWVEYRKDNARFRY